MKRFTLGAGVNVDLDRLIDTRLLVQANSGGGKSWALRRLLEQTHGHVQHLVIDPEGEFASLREKFDYVLAAKHGGDTAADPRMARLLAERLLELNVSAILDIYELKAHERVRFVREFLEALVDAPKKLWHRAIVVVDEAHVYCPQAGEAESAGAVIDLATRGRKRGFAAVFATQRLSKLHKDAAAECNNKLIGRTGLDVDVKRAADELGLGKERWKELRDLEAGEFFAFGPALSREVVRVKVGGVATTHPKAGARLAAATVAPTAKIRALLPKLADLPAEVEKKAKTEADLRKEIADLKRELRVRPSIEVEKPEVRIERVEVPAISPAVLKEIEHAAHAFTGAAGHLIGLSGEILSPLVTIADRLTTIQKQHATGLSARVTGSAGVVRSKTPASPPGNDRSIGVGERKILTAIAQHTDSVSREQLTVLTGYKRSTRDTYLQRLREKNLIEIDGTAIVASAGAAVVLGSDFQPLPVGDELREHWLERLPEGERKILEVAVQAYPGQVLREAVSEATGYARSSRDTYIQRLGARRLIVSTRGSIRASEELFG